MAHGSSVPDPSRDLDAIVDQLVQVLKGHRDLQLGILYGSAVTGTLHADSDIDLALAVDTRTPVPHDTLLAVSLEAGRLIGREVQVRDLSAARGVFLKQVLTSGRVVLQRDPTVRAELIIRMLDFVEDMLPNVRMIRARGRERLIAGQ